MAFTIVTLTGTYQQASASGDTPASGTLTFTLTTPMSNATQTVPVAPISVTLDDNGKFSIDLPSNEDTGTVPAATRWGVTEQIAGAQPRDYFISIPTSSPVDISTLIPTAIAWN